MPRRRAPTHDGDAPQSAEPGSEPVAAARSGADETPPPKAAQDLSTSFQTSKSAILCLLGVVSLFAFLSAWHQNAALIGERGLAPATPYLDHLHRHGGGRWRHPTIFWLFDLNDANLNVTALAGCGLALLLACGVHSFFVVAGIWLLYFSIVTVAEGSNFYAYGWEAQLLETTFLCAFLCAPFDVEAPPSKRVLYLLRWLTFRISVGAGLIKARGGSCWADRTCLWYHFETQPVPSPLSFAFHFLPRWALSRGVDLDFAVQLYTSWLVLLPGCNFGLRLVRRSAGLVQALFMVNIALSGNFATLNHLTIVPIITCLDDGCLGWLAAALPRRRRAPRARAARSHLSRYAVDVCLVAVVAWLSAPVVANLASSKQVMNASFDPFRLVNSYGAFGSVGEKRYEAIISVNVGGEWVELDLPCKPGNVRRRPCFSAPYHHRLDWNLWFLGFKPHRQMLQQRESWLYAFLEKLLSKDAAVVSLLAADSRAALAKEPRPLAAVKVDMFWYRMAQPLHRAVAEALRSADGQATWWNRTFEELLLPPLHLDQNGKLALAA
ncbi:lipase maturation factor-domain-containing protein [Pelagophyceae sp. CCMP2097]|nr:lipase maturation factor-domain-containing protein [Pelagophyceae sp. CCMP2097]|mmetsp:Transcript_22778/g.77022  ORF Transcript_22778/g.77022 Transcript_22778/m.77022 type:complete len:551 (-) Transcript_22778:152-1804(-)